MISFFKKLFAAPKEKEIVTLDALQRTISDQIDEQSATLRDKLPSYQEKRNQLLADLTQAVVDLEKAKLQNPNIRAKEKHFMEGNREAYIKSTQQLIRAVHDLSLDEQEIETYAKKIKDQLITFARHTTRQYGIISQFFGNEANRIASLLKQLEKHSEELKKEHSSGGIAKLSQIENQIKAIEQSEKTLLNLKEQLVDHSLKLKQIQNSESEVQSQIVAKQDSNAYQELQSLRSKKQELVRTLKVKESNYLHDFSSLQAALKKYERVSLEYQDLIRGYVEDPIPALIDDKDYKISEILSKLKDALHKDSLDLKDRKKEKTILLIEKLTQEQLEHFASEYQELSTQIEELTEKLKEQPITLEIAELQKQIESIRSEEQMLMRKHFDQDIEKQKKTIEDQKNELLILYKNYYGHALELKEKE